MNRVSRSLGLVSILLLASACSASSDEGANGEAALSNLKLAPLWADAKRLDLGDLRRLSVGFATDALNDQLSNANNGIALEAPAVFGEQADPNLILPDRAEVKGLDAIVSGLASRFGEKELSTEVNALRLAHLKDTEDDYYVEAGFSARAGINHGWNFDASGLVAGASVRIGIDAGAEIGARVVLAARSDGLKPLVGAPLAAARQLRGFVAPRSADDIRAMKPGEMFSLRGKGKLGGNFGLGVPVLVAGPAPGVTYSVVVSAGVAAVLEGQLDVQLLRLNGDEVVVDVGVQNGRAVSANAGIRDAWGIKGLCPDDKQCLRTVNLGVTTVDLASVVEKAIQDRLNDYLSFKVEASASLASNRVSVSRFRFHLDGGTTADREEVAKALEQTLKFDVRYAQAVSNRDLGEKKQGVEATFDLVRSATTSTRSFGVEALGINLYQRAIVQNEGSCTVQTPDGARSILFDSAYDHRGLFQTDFTSSRLGVSAQTVNRSAPLVAKSEANLFLQSAVGDAHVDDDTLVDALDSLIVALGGPEVLAGLDKLGNPIEQRLRAACDLDLTANAFDACVVDFNKRQSTSKTTALAALKPLVAKASAPLAPVLEAAMTVRLNLQSSGFYNKDQLSGAKASMGVDARFDDRALDALTRRSRADYERVLQDYLVALTADRSNPNTNASAVRASLGARFGDRIQKMAHTFEDRAADYRRIADVEAEVPKVLAGKQFISTPIGIRFVVDRNDAKRITETHVRSLAHERAQAAADLFDNLTREADDLGAPLFPAHAAMLPLISLVPQNNLEIALAFDVDAKSSLLVKRDRFEEAGLATVRKAGTGSAVSIIQGGMFNLQRIISGN